MGSSWEWVVGPGESGLEVQPGAVEWVLVLWNPDQELSQIGF
jgi:hypothetical protein